jgi:hypothetical protein
MNIPRLVLLPNPVANNCRAHHIESIGSSDMHQAYLFAFVTQYPEHLHLEFVSSHFPNDLKK